ncbi:MAG: hypothetical protein U0840_07935 [Gemmataceae bacterium]
MLRSLMCSVLALAVFASFAFCADEEAKKKKKKKQAAGPNGTIAQVDPDKGSLTVKVAIKKKQTEDREYKVTDKTTVTLVQGETRTPVKADKVAELLKLEPFKIGAGAVVETEEDGKTAKSITLSEAGPAKKKKKKKATEQE